VENAARILRGEKIGATWGSDAGRDRALASGPKPHLLSGSPCA